jgi:uncharacterized protein YoxC
VTEPLFWLGLSLLLVAISLTAVLIAAIPALQELARAARSAEKLFDTLSRELPPTLDSIRMTGLEITDLTEDVQEGVKSAGQVVKQVDQSLDGARKQAQNLQVGTRSLFVGVKAAWKSFTRQKPASRRNIDRKEQTQKPQLPSGDWEFTRENRRPVGEPINGVGFRNNEVYDESRGWVNGYDNKFDEEDLHPKSIKPTATDDWSDSL